MLMTMALTGQRRRWIVRGFLALLVVCSALIGGLGVGSSVAARRLAGTATVTGYVRLCGGPAPGRCYIEEVGFCQPPQGCVTSDRVAAIDARGRRVATQRLHHARFTLHLAPGRYTIELLGDGRRVHGRVMQRRKVRAEAHRTAVVRFFFAIP